MTAELAAKKDGTMTALRIKTLADHGYADAAANPSKFPAGLFSICTGSYDIKTAFTEMDAAYTNKPPGGVAYRCSFRVTEAVHAIERVTDVLAQELKMDPAELRFKNFIQADQFPYKSALGWEYDSGNYKDCLQKALDKIGYADLRKEQAEKRAKGELMGIGISSFTEIVGAGPSRDFDIPGHQDVRLGGDPHPSHGQGDRALRHQVAGPGARATLRPDRRRRAGIPRGAHPGRRGAIPTRPPTALGTYASRSTPTAGAAARRWRRGKIRAKAKKIAALPAGSQRGRPRVGRSASSPSRGRRRSRRPSRSSPSRPTPTIRRAWRRVSKRWTTTIRRT